ncbi:MAG: hypothetical protein SNJ71_04470, partial [Bacteroidales bacterium]
MKQFFAILIQKHRTLGWILNPYILSKDDDFVFYSPYESLLQTKEIGVELDENQKKAVKTLNGYNEKELIRIFCKQKTSTKDFIDKIDEKLLKEHIRPFIEKVIVKCLDELKETQTRFFLHKRNENIYPEDEYFLEKITPETIFNFEKTPDELRYYLSLFIDGKNTSLLKKEHITLSTEPCRIIINRKLYYFNDIDANKLTPFFTKPYITIPSHIENKYFETFILNSIKKFRVNAIGFDIIDKYYECKPRFVITTDLVGMPCFNVFFNYDKISIASNQTRRFTLEMLKENDTYSYVKYHRDLAVENEIIQFLKAENIKIKENVYYLDGTVHSFTEIFSWLDAKQEFIRQYNISIEGATGIKYRISDYKLNIKYTKVNDWFDVNASVQWGEFIIPFKKLRNHIKNHIQEYVLPNGDIAIIPEEWFAKYYDFFVFSKEAKDTIKIHSHHIAIVSGTGEKELKEIAREAFQHIKNEDIADITLPEKLQATLRPYQMDGFQWLYILNKLQ